MSYSVSQSPCRTRPRSFKTSIPRRILSLGDIFLPRLERIPCVFPRIYLLPEPIQRPRFRDQLHLTTSIRPFHSLLQILEQNPMGQIGGNGYLDGQKGVCRGGRVNQGKVLVETRL